MNRRYFLNRTAGSFAATLLPVSAANVEKKDMVICGRLGMNRHVVCFQHLFQQPVVRPA